MKIFLIILAAYIMYKIQVVLFRKVWKKGLKVFVRFDDDACTEGEEGRLTETIINRKKLPLPTLQVKFLINGSLRFNEMENTVITDNTYTNDIFSVNGFEKITRHHSFICKKRGVYHIDRIDVISHDLFLSDKNVDTVDNTAVLCVYPSLVDLSLINIPFERLMGTILTKRMNLEDPFEFRSIREYQPFDPMSSVNWKASAKTGDLMVNLHNYTATQEVTIFLDIESGTLKKFDDLSEEAIRLAATFASLLLSKGIITELVSNGCDMLTGDPLYVRPGAGKSHLTTINEGLARIDLSKRAVPIVKNVRAASAESNAADRLYIMISRVSKDELKEAYIELTAHAHGSLWIAPLHPDMEVPAVSQNFDTVKWEVPYGK